MKQVNQTIKAIDTLSLSSTMLNVRYYWVTKCQLLSFCQWLSGRVDSTLISKQTSSAKCLWTCDQRLQVPRSLQTNWTHWSSHLLRWDCGGVRVACRSLRILWRRLISCSCQNQRQGVDQRATGAYRATSSECARVLPAGRRSVDARALIFLSTSRTSRRTCRCHMSRRTSGTFLARGCGGRAQCASRSPHGTAPYKWSHTRRWALASHSARSLIILFRRSARAAPRTTRCRCGSVPPANSCLRSNTRAVCPSRSCGTHCTLMVTCRMGLCTRRAGRRRCRALASRAPLRCPYPRGTVRRAPSCSSLHRCWDPSRRLWWASASGCGERAAGARQMRTAERARRRQAGICNVLLELN